MKLEMNQYTRLLFDLSAAVLNCESPWNTSAGSFNTLQEHLRLAIFYAMDLAFLLAIWQFIEAGLASHFLQGVERVGSRAKGYVGSKRVDIYFERFVVISSSLGFTISRFQWVWIWVKKEEESTLFACSGCFPFKLFDIKGVAKLALKDGRLKLVTEGQFSKLWSFFSQKILVPLVGAEGNERRWRKVSVIVRF